MPIFDIIAFDADDTLWHTEYLYKDAQTQIKSILANYTSSDNLDDQLYQAEMRNLAHFGYGIKGFALSMIESAIELSAGNINPTDIQTLLDIVKHMLMADIRIIDGVPETLTTLAAAHTLMLLTKGDLYDQESKIERSGLAAHFKHIEIVSQKYPATYQGILSKYKIRPSRFLMIGNSLRSDILPVLDIGAYAAYVPHPLTWAHEMTDIPADHPNFSQIEQFSQLPRLLATMG